MKQKLKIVNEAEYPDLIVSTKPTNLLKIVRTGNAATLETQDINIFYVLADFFEKRFKALKEQCRTVIIARREEGKPTGEQQQHREFFYQLPTGSAHLTIQERIILKPNPQKLEALLRSKNLYESALTSTIDPDKVNAMYNAGLITPEEFTSISDAPKPSYALIARFDAIAEKLM